LYSVFGQTLPRQAAPASPQSVPNFVDENGYVDMERQSAYLSELDQRTAHAEQVARQAQEAARQQEQRRQATEAHKVYPQIDPNSDQFDPRAFKLVRNAALASMLDGTEPPELLDIAKDVLSSYKASPNEEEVKEKAVAEYKEKQTAKAQASAVQPGKGQPREETTNLDELRRRTLAGDDTALDERLKNI
jgi:hypothetical protein